MARENEIAEGGRLRRGGTRLRPKGQHQGVFREGEFDVGGNTRGIRGREGFREFPFSVVFLQHGRGHDAFLSRGARRDRARGIFRRGEGRSGRMHGAALARSQREGINASRGFAVGAKNEQRRGKRWRKLGLDEKNKS